MYLTEDVPNIRFIYDRMKPDILISNKHLKHLIQNQSFQCGTEFDGKGEIFAHVYNSDLINLKQEILGCVYFCK